jgi:hypothetical protein
MRASRFTIQIATALLVLSPNAQSKDKKKNPAPKDPQDTIEVVGHIPPIGGAVTRFLSTHHYSSYYLYVEHESGKDVTLIDVSKTTQPVVLADIPSAPNGGSASLFAVAGTAALLTEEASNVQSTKPQTIRIMDFSDPKQPKVAREFAGVTAVSRDDQRGLIFVANPEGIWILHQSYALDPEVQREYARHVLYDH